MKREQIFTAIFVFFLAITNYCFATIHFVTDGGNSGPNTLRGKIIAASFVSGDTIQFSGVSTVTLTVGDTSAGKGLYAGLEISNHLTIDGGNGVVIQRSGSNEFRIFDVEPGIHLNLISLVLKNGKANYGGGVVTLGNLTMTNCSLVNNTADFGGAISSISGQTVGAGSFLYDGKFTLTNCTISGNSAKFGGAIHDIPATFSFPKTITNCTITNNTATDSAGGIWLATDDPFFAGDTNSVLNFTNTIITGNTTNGVLDNIRGGIQNGGNSIVGANDTYLDTLKSHNGSVLLVHPILGCSPAINSGNDSVAPTTDQIGQNRVGTAVDIGAFEYQGSFSTSNIKTVTSGNDFGSGTLRDKICFASDGDTIQFSGVSEVTLKDSSLVLDKNLTILGGNGVTVQRDTSKSKFRIFEITNGKTVNFSNLRIKNGNVLGNGGGILNQGTLTLDSCSVDSNYATTGGGIYVETGATLNLLNSTIFANASLHNGTIGNDVNGMGGGIFIKNASTTKIQNSTIYLNGAEEGGGGIASENSATESFLYITNSTITSNVAENADKGGGIYFMGNTNAPVLNTIISGNLAGIPNQTSDFAKKVNIYSKSMTSLGYNIDGSTQSGFFELTDLPGVSPTFTGFASVNNSFTKVLKLDSTSYGVNQGTATSSGSNIVSAKDQIGQSRVGLTDIGAFEFQQTVTVTPPPISSLCVKNGFDSGNYSLRSVIGNATNGDTITFCGVSTVTLTGGELNVDKNLVIDGESGVTITRSSGSFRNFGIQTNKTVNFKNLTISNGNSSADGGGIRNYGSLTLDSCSVENNSTSNGKGGGIYNEGTLIGVACTFSGNTSSSSADTLAGNGGAIFTANNSTLTLVNCTISGNTSKTGGGAISDDSQAATINLTNCTVFKNHNQKMTNGGAFNLASSSLNLKNTIVGENTFSSFNQPGNFYDASLSGTGKINSLGYNIDRYNDLFLIEITDQTYVDPKLDSTLADNGGPTKTHKLLAGSPAIGKGTNTNAPTKDQRGRDRIGTFDIGAFEFGATSNSTVPTPANVGNQQVTDISFETNLNVTDNGTNLGSLNITDNSAGGSASVTISRYTSQSSTAPNGVGFWWNIEVTGTWTGTLVLSYAGLNLNGVAESSLKVWHYNGTIWEDLGGVVNTTLKTITVTGLTQNDFSPFTLGDGDNPLAVELNSISAKVEKDGIRINWQTESELNNKGFFVERSEDSKEGDFVRVSGLINGNGTSTSSHNYTFFDKNVKLGQTYFYRLIDVDSETGIETEHEAIEIIFDELTNLLPKKYALHQNFPNPFNPSTTIKFDLPKTTFVNLNIYNIKGQLVKSLVSKGLEAGFHKIAWNGTNELEKPVSSGIYFYKINTTEFTKIYKMTFLK